MSVQYTDPFGAAPIAVQNTGLQVTLDATGQKQDTVAYGQFLADGVPVGSPFTQNSRSSLALINSAPLAPNRSYVLKVQYAPKGTKPVWTSDSISQAAILAQQLRITALSVTPTGVLVSWDAPAGGTIGGARLQIIGPDASGKIGVLWSVLTQEPTAPIPFTFAAGTAYFVRVSAIQSIVGSNMGNFTRPFTVGPPSVPLPIPLGAPAITSVVLGNGMVTAQWTPPAPTANAPTPRYELLLLDGTNVVAAATAGPTGGQIAMAGLGAFTTPQVAARMSFGPFTGPAGPPAPLYALAPTITSVQVTSKSAGGAQIQVSAASPGTLPKGGTLMATLYTNGVAGTPQPVSGATPATFAVNPVTAGALYAVDAMVVVASGPQSCSGPRSPRLIVPLAAPAVAAAGYDGRTVTIDLAFDSPVPVDGYSVALVGGANPTFRVGSALPISFPASLDLSAGYTLSVTPLIGVVGGASSQSASLALPTMAAPSLTAVDYDGMALSVRWSAATLPFLSGYRVAVSGGPSVTTGEETHCVIPLAPGQAGATVTVTALSPLRKIASAAAAIVSSPVTVAAVAVDPATGIATASWTAVPGATGYLLRLIQDGAETDVLVEGATSYAFTPPPGAALALALASITTGGGARATGPFGPAAPAPNLAPILASSAFDGASLTLAWAPVPGATGYRATVFKGASTKILQPPNFPASATQANFALPQPAATDPYSVVLQALFGTFEGAASVAAPVLVAPAGLGSSTFDGRTIVASLTAPAGPAPAGYAVTLLRDGAAIQQATGAAPNISLAVAEPVIPGSAYALVVRPIDGIATGPAATAAVVSDPPSLVAVVWNATIDVTASLPAGCTGGQARLLVDGVPGTPAVLGAKGKASLTPPPSGAVALSLQATTGGTTGPWSAPFPLPAAAPSGLALQTGNGVLQARWESVGGADGYAVTLTTGKAAVAVTVVDQPEAELTLPAGATSASVAVAAVTGLATGPKSAPVAAILAQVPLTQLTCQDGMVAMSWAALPTGATGYRAALLAGESVVAEADFSQSPGSLAVPPGVYGAVVRAFDAAALGPAASPAVPLMAAPVIASASFDAASGDCTVTWPAIAGAASYGIQLAAAGQSPFPDNAAGPSYTIRAAKLTGGPYAFSCRALGAGTAPAVIGPWSAALALPVAIPIGLTLQVDGDRLEAAWAGVEAADGYSVTLTTDKAAAKTVEVYQPRTAFTLPAGAKQAGVSVAAVFGVAIGRPCAPVAAPLTAPAPLSLAYDGIDLSLSWGSVPDATGYRVALTAGLSVVAQADFTATKGTIALPAGRCGVLLRALQGNAAGPASAPVAPITAAPAIASAVFDPVSGSCTITWPAIAGAAKYEVRLGEPGRPPFPDNVSAASYTIAAARLTGGGPFSFSARAVGTGPPALTGPWSMPVALPSLAPEAVETRFDGTTLRARWSPVGGAEGYRLWLISAGSPTLLGDVAGARATIVPATAPAAGAALAVQAIGPLGAGPASAAQPLVSRAWYLTGQAPWGLAPLTGPTATPADLVLALPELFGTAHPTVTLTGTTFKIESASPGYTLTILGGGPAWKLNSSRATVQTDYIAMLTALEAANWTPQARALVLEAVARALPQTFDESLYFAYGFEPAQGSFDLRPGMVLHVEYEAYQYLGPLADPTQASYLDGYTASAAADYPITGSGSKDNWFVTLDAALARMAASEGIEVPTMAPQGDFSPGGGGLIDAFFDEFRQPLCRVVYPPNILSQSSFGDARLTDNPVLLAASNLADLAAATQAVRNQTPIPANVGAFYFRGRATLSPRIRIIVDDVPLLVAVGTSVGDVLAGQGARAASPGAGLRVRRATGPAAILSERPPSLDVRLDWLPGNPAWLDLPLMAGDRIETGW